MSASDDLMYQLLKAKKNGDKIYYQTKVDEGLRLSPPMLVGEDHIWNLESNCYKIRKRREFIILVDKEGNPNIYEKENYWTRSDFGPNADGGEYILMREVYQEEM